MRSANGSIRKRDNGTWEYRATIHGVRKSFYGRTRNEVLTKYRDYCRNNAPIESNCLVEDFVKLWLETYKKPQVSYNTYVCYKFYCEEYILPLFKKRRVCDVTTAEIKKMFNDPNVLKKSTSYQQKLYLVAKGIFDSAEEDGLCKSPVPKRTFKKDKDYKPKVFTKDQIPKIITAAEKHRYGHLILLLLYTGLREGELCALEWNDIQEDYIHINKTYARADHGQSVKETKSGRSRIVAISDELRKILDSLPKETDTVISCEGRPCSTWTFNRQYRKFFEENNLDYLSPHKCRHTYATYLLESGADVYMVKALLGHASVQTTEIYTHIDIDPIKKAGKKLSYNFVKNQ